VAWLSPLGWSSKQKRGVVVQRRGARTSMLGTVEREAPGASAPANDSVASCSASAIAANLVAISQLD